jgi:ABC-2 type transport system ATP-binding protein
MPILETRDLTKIYGNKMIAVNGVTMSVEKGRVFGLLGPNGAGKTTLLKLLMGLQIPTAGRAELFGKRTGPNASHLRQRVGYLPTNPKFPPTMTPITYLDMIGQLFGMNAEERKPRLASLIRAVDLLPAAARPIKSFSTGMTTRLGIAASLINDPELLIWDEPTAGLDPAGRKYTLDLIRELGKTKTMVVSSHILSDIDRVCDSVGIMHEGKLIYCGSVRELKQTIGQNNVEMEVDGAEPMLETFTRRLEGMPEVLGCVRQGGWMDIRFSPNEPIAAPLGKALMMASELGVDVIAVSSTRSQTEDAFIYLLKADQSDGFSRAFNTQPSSSESVGSSTKS